MRQGKLLVGQSNCTASRQIGCFGIEDNQVTWWISTHSFVNTITYLNNNNNNNHEIQVLGTEVPLRTAQLFWIVFERFIFPRVVMLFFE